MHWRLFFEVVSLVAAVVALVVGVYHLIEIRRATSALSTRYLGKFPHFLPDIVDLLNGVRHEIIIFCDFPGYADFTDPARALEYRQALERLQQKHVKLELTCLDSDSRAMFVREQFPAADWENWSSDPRKSEKALAFLKANAEMAEPTKATLDDILKVMDDVDTRIIKHVFRGSGSQISTAMPIYFWIADARSAIFSIPTLSDEAVEYGFKTSDHALIQALMEMRLRYRKTTTAG